MKPRRESGWRCVQICSWRAYQVVGVRPACDAMPKEGIRDWKQKLRLFKGLLDVTTNPQFVDTVVKGANWRPADVDAIKDRLPKWDQSRPMQAPGPAFFSLLADKLPTRDIILGQLLIELSIAEYVERLPKDDPAVKAV